MIQAIVDFYSYQYSTSHLFFPKIIITLLIVLGAIIVIPKAVTAVRAGKGFTMPKFFVDGFDPLKLFGTIVLMILYVLALDNIGFVPASIIFVFLFNVLFCGTLNPKSLLISAVIAVVAPVATYYIFGVLFNVTLP